MNYCLMKSEPSTWSRDDQITKGEAGEGCETYHPDPTDASGRFSMVTMKAVKPMARTVMLAEMKGGERLADMAPVRQARLSVTPVSAAQWDIVMELGKTSI